jgi:hypothetical protein
MFFGYIYLNNPSKRAFKEVWNLNEMQGLEVFNYRPNSNGEYEMIVDSHSDDILILRRTEENCSFKPKQTIIAL